MKEIEYIIEWVTQEYGITPSSLFENRNKERHVLARTIVFLMAYKFSLCRVGDLAIYFGQDRTSSNAALHRGTEFLNNPTMGFFKKVYDIVEKKYINHFKETEEMNNFGSLIKFMCGISDMSIKELSLRSGVSLRALYYYQNGEKIPDIDRMEVIMKALGCRVLISRGDDLYEYNSKNEKNN